MKKILAILFSLRLILIMAAPALAVTPTFTPPSLPQIPELKFDLSGFWERFWGDHAAPDATEPEPTEAPETEPAGLPAPVITDSRYVHNSPVRRLEIDWDAVEGADSYEVLITRADGTVETCTTDTDLLCRGMECPKVYIDSTGTWTAATVQVRALSGSRAGDWSAAVKIGCNMIH